jgi:cytidine deaminase
MTARKDKDDSPKPTTELSDGDRELIAAARQIIRERYKPDWHRVGAALRTRSGKVYAAVHLEAYVGRIAVCAEAIAIGMAVSAGERGIERIVAVRHTGNVVSPCGMCRELISDYAPEALVIVPAPHGETLMPIGKLLPNKYHRG